MNGRACSMGESDFYAARSCGYAFSYFTIIRGRCCTPFQAEGTLRSNACEPERRFLTTRLASVRVLVEVELSSRQTRFFAHTFVQFSFGRSASIKAGINNERSVFSDRNSDARQTFCRLSPYEFFERTLVSTMCPPLYTSNDSCRKRRLFLEEEKARAINSTLLEVECRCKTSSQFVHRPYERGTVALSKNACRPLSTRGEGEEEEEGKEKKRWPAIISLMRRRILFTTWL